MLGESLLRIKGSRTCPHCGNTLADVRRLLGSKGKPGCAAAPAGDIVACVMVQGKSDAQDGWTYLGPTRNPGLFGHLVKVAAPDPAAQVRQTFEELKAKRGRAELDLRQRNRLARNETAAEDALHAYEHAVKTGDVQAQAEQQERLRKLERRLERARRKGLTAIAPGLGGIRNPAIEADVKRRLSGPDAGAQYRALQQAAIRQPQLGAFPAMAGSPFADAEGRLLVRPGDAVILATNGAGEVIGMQTYADPDRNAAGKYAYAPAGPAVAPLDGDEALLPRHLTVTVNGKVDGGALFSGSAVASLLQQACRGHVLVCDGALKAMTTTAATGNLTLGSPGAMHRQTLHQIKAALAEVEEQIGKRPKVLISVDAGDISNPQGAIAQLILLYHALWADTYEACFLWWDQRTKADGDIDELHQREALLGNVHSSSFSRLTPRELLTKQPPEAREIAEQVLASQTASGARLLPAEEVAEMPLEMPFEDDPEAYTFDMSGGKDALVDALRRIQADGYQAALVQVPTGEGKTFAAVQIQPEELGMRRLILTTPHVLTLVDEYRMSQPDLVAIRGKDSGRVRTQDGRIVRADDPSDPSLLMAANCSQGNLIDFFRKANAGDIAAEHCTKCPDRRRCSTKPGWYLLERSIADAARRVVAFPASLRGSSDIWNSHGGVYSKKAGHEAGTLWIADEFGAVSWEKTLTVSWDEMATTYRLTKGKQPKALRSAFEALLRLPRPKGYETVLGPQLRALLMDSGTQKKRYGAQAPQKLSHAHLLGSAAAAEMAAVQAKDPNSRVRKVWLDEFVSLLVGDPKSYCTLTAAGLTFTSETKEVKQVLTSGGIGMTVAMDATGTRRETELRLGRRVAVLRARQSVPTKKHRRIQVVGWAGNTGYNRDFLTQWQLRLVRDAIPSFLGIDEASAEKDIAWIDTLRSIGSGEYGPDQRTAGFMSGSRGINSMADCKALVLCGTPIPNLTGTAARWFVLTGQAVHPGDSMPVVRLMQTTTPMSEGQWVSFGKGHINRDFRAWAYHGLESEIVQAAGRGRFNRRPDEDTYLVCLTDAALPFITEIVELKDILGEATVQGMQKLRDFDTIAKAWRSLTDRRRDGLCLADALDVDLPLLADRCRAADACQTEIATAVFTALSRAARRQMMSEISPLRQPVALTGTLSGRIGESTAKPAVTATQGT